MLVLGAVLVFFSTLSILGAIMSLFGGIFAIFASVSTFIAAFHFTFWEIVLLLFLITMVVITAGWLIFKLALAIEDYVDSL